MPTALHRPEPSLRRVGDPVHRDTPPRGAAIRLRDGGTLYVADAWHTGLVVLEALRALLGDPPSGASFPVRQAARRAWLDASSRLLVPVIGGKIAVSGAPDIGFLGELYPDLDRFGLPFVAALDLFNAWKRFDEGVHLAVLGHRVHPFYGTYAPTRTTHLELFATWLAQHGGPRGRAVDVGTGCGVLALMLCRAGFPEVHAVDISPNAALSVRRQLARVEPPPPITVHEGDLLDGLDGPFDLIAFNPPWIQGRVASPLDRALYFDDDLFERFFAQALARLSPDGRIVLVFSNLVELVQPDVGHPIQAELARGRLREVQVLRRRVQGTLTDEGRERRTKEKVEVWELARA
jgi:predicted nicotinamide N-methyase